MQMSSPIVYIKRNRLSPVERSPSRNLYCFASKSLSFTVFSWVEILSNVILPFFRPEIFHFESCDFVCFVFPPLFSIVIVRMDGTALSTRRVRSGSGLLTFQGKFVAFLPGYFVFSRYSIVVRL